MEKYSPRQVIMGITNLGGKWKCGELEHASDNGWQVLSLSSETVYLLANFLLELQLVHL